MSEVGSLSSVWVERSTRIVGTFVEQHGFLRDLQTCVGVEIPVNGRGTGALRHSATCKSGQSQSNFYLFSKYQHVFCVFVCLWYTFFTNNENHLY